MIEVRLRVTPLRREREMETKRNPGCGNPRRSTAPRVCCTATRGRPLVFRCSAFPALERSRSTTSSSTTKELLAHMGSIIAFCCGHRILLTECQARGPTIPTIAVGRMRSTMLDRLQAPVAVLRPGMVPISTRASYHSRLQTCSLLLSGFLQTSVNVSAALQGSTHTETWQFPR